VWIDREGYPFIGAAVAGTLAAAWWLHWSLVIPGGLLLLFLLNFFRDPERRIPDGPVLVSPADGRVMAVRPAAGDAGEPFVSIFMNPLDVHVNRAPLAGTIVQYQYFRGRFKPAFEESAGMENERNMIVIQGDRCQVRLSQIAGILARRIVFRKKVGDVVRTGERIGMIRFGSRVDLWLPREARVVVRAGQKVKAGNTILAEINHGN